MFLISDFGYELVIVCFEEELVVIVLLGFMVGMIVLIVLGFLL